MKELIISYLQFIYLVPMRLIKLAKELVYSKLKIGLYKPLNNKIEVRSFLNSLSSYKYAFKDRKDGSMDIFFIAGQGSSARKFGNNFSKLPLWNKKQALNFHYTNFRNLLNMKINKKYKGKLLEQTRESAKRLEKKDFWFYANNITIDGVRYNTTIQRTGDNFTLIAYEKTENCKS